MKKILISSNPWQTRIAVMRDGLLQNIYFASATKQSLERSFFKGKVIKVLPGIQTAFVDIGQAKAGFLHISEIDRQLALQRMSSSVEIDEEVKVDNYQPLDIAKIFKENESILVQVSKEPVYEKGAKLTTCFTLPGRFIVMMPNIPRIAISKKIDNQEERQRLKGIVRSLLPEGMGGIIRTTSENRQEKEIAQDIKYLVQTWNNIQKSYKEAEPEAKIYEDIPLAFQIVRDHLDSDVDEVICDNQKEQQEVYRFVKKIAPEYALKVKYYKGHQDLFDRFNVDKQLQDALSQKVNLKSGGSIIVETTQAMTVIDVNTGRYTGKANMEETILRTNLEAAEETVRQLRLRNIGGLIVIDFIDMAQPQNRQRLFKFFEKMLKERDKFQSVVLKISEFGLVQMTRKRSGKTLLQELTESCNCCDGLGYVKTLDTIACNLLPKIKQSLYDFKKADTVTILLKSEMFEYIANQQYNTILDFEKKFNKKIIIIADDAISLDSYVIK